MVNAGGHTAHGRLEHLTPDDLAAILTPPNPPARPGAEEPATPPDLSTPTVDAVKPTTGLRARFGELLALRAETHPPDPGAPGHRSE
ncbi:hypothetical protein [Actinorhabdospora filicis]|nr:hypothetical protein [Actinorhabdospora filicis]